MLGRHLHPDRARPTLQWAALAAIGDQVPADHPDNRTLIRLGLADLRRGATTADPRLRALVSVSTATQCNLHPDSALYQVIPILNAPGHLERGQDYVQAWLAGSRFQDRPRSGLPDASAQPAAPRGAARQ